MELLFELIFDLLLEGSAEIAKDKKVSPWIRIPCLILVLAVAIIVLGGLGFVGIYMLIRHTDSTDIFMSIFCLMLDFILIISAIREYKKYKNKKLS